MFNEASLHSAKCSHSARILAQISLYNLATFRQNEQNAARLARRQALVINTRVVARQKPSRSPIFFPSAPCILQGKPSTRGTGLRRGGKRRGKDAIGAPVAPKSCYLRLPSVTVISHPFVFGIALNWLARACVFSRPTRHACACLLRISLSSEPCIFMILDTRLN